MEWPELDLASDVCIEVGALPPCAVTQTLVSSRVPLGIVTGAAMGICAFPSSPHERCCEERAIAGGILHRSGWVAHLEGCCHLQTASTFSVPLGFVGSERGSHTPQTLCL